MRCLLLLAEEAKSNFNRKYDQKLSGYAGSGFTQQRFWDIKPGALAKCIPAKSISMVQGNKKPHAFAVNALFSIFFKAGSDRRVRGKAVSGFFLSELKYCCKRYKIIHR